MTPANKPLPQGTPVQPNLSSLLARYLQRQAEAHTNGVAAADPSEVVPYEVGPVQPIDAKPAWDAAMAVTKFYGSVDARTMQAPPQWPHLVTAHEPETALPFCVGNFPQLVRNFQALMQTKNIADLRPSAGRPVHAPAMTEWANQPVGFPRLLVNLGTARLAKQFDVADALVQANDATVPSEWQAAWANEKAALAWQRGNFEEARAQWQKLPASVPVLFNRGMAALFCGHAAEARTALTEAVNQLPETSAWYHLGRLYLTMVAGDK
ncbi:MAG TPA: hypothetical protein VE988_22675 [Gemmataceae bacterium]|nr:hypothetical protein [Gemmataceae bacterium]